MRRFSAVLACIAFGLSAPAEAADLFVDETFTPTVADPGPKWGAWGEIGGAYGSDESSFGELTIFVPFMQAPDSLFFTELNAKYFEGDILEGNAALGYRWMSGTGFNFGVWGGLDVRHTDSDNTFGQVSGGLEALSEYFDARINGYLPFTDAQTVDDGIAEVILEGSNIFMIGGEEVALYGVDGEIGGRLPLFGNNGATLGVYGGGFWFDHDDAYEEIAGGKARVELSFTDVINPGSEITAQYAYSHDNVRGDRHFIGGALRIPLGPSRAARDMSPQEWRMIDGLERDNDIVIGQSDEEPVEDAKTDVDFNVVQYAAGGGSVDPDPGTDEKLIIATGAFTGNQTLQANRTLQGGGSTIQVRGLNSGAVAGFTAPGSRPTIDADTGAVITVADRTHLAGLDITGGGGRGNFVDDNDGVLGAPGIFAAFSDLDVSGVGDDGFNFRDADGATTHFHDVRVSDTGSEGINFSIAEGVMATLHEVRVSNTGNDSIDFSSAEDANVDFRKVWASGTDSEGISFAGSDNATVDFYDVWVSDTAREGINFSGADDVTVGFREVRVANIGEEGIRFDVADGSTVDFRDVRVWDISRQGIDFRNADGAMVDFRDVWVTNTGTEGLADQGAGIDFRFTAGPPTTAPIVTFENVHVTETFEAGITFDRVDGAMVDFYDVSVSDTGGEGIDFSRAEGATATFTNVRVSETDTVGIDFNRADGATVSFTNVDVSGTGEEGIYFSAAEDGVTVTFTDVRVSDTDFEGIDFNQAVGADVTFRNVHVSDTDGDGMAFAGAKGAQLSFIDVHVSGTGRNGINFGEADGAMVDFRNVRVSDTDQRGIDFREVDGATVSFDGVTFAGVIGSDGPDFEALFRASGAPLPTINGDIVNHTDNIPFDPTTPNNAMCQGTFSGAVTVTNGGSVVIGGTDCAAIP